MATSLGAGVCEPVANCSTGCATLLAPTVPTAPNTATLLSRPAAANKVTFLGNISFLLSGRCRPGELSLVLERNGRSLPRQIESRRAGVRIRPYRRVELTTFVKISSSEAACASHDKTARKWIAQTSAMSRAGPPVASFTFASPTTSVAPEAGTRSRLATFSRPQRPDGSHSRCVLKSFDGP